MNLVKRATIALLSSQLFLAERKLEKRIARLKSAEAEAEYAKRDVDYVAGRLRTELGESEAS